MEIEQLKEEFSARCILQSNSVLVFNKPARFETIVKGGGNTKFCLTSIVRRTLGHEVYPCHRLDRDTSGCQIFALNSESLEYFENIFKEKKINKLYLGICLGGFMQDKGKIKSPLTAWQRGKEPVRIAGEKDKGKLTARTDYRVLAVSDISEKDGIDNISLASFKLYTGRTHQIRVHCKSINHPLIGDDQYGERKINKSVKKRTGFSRHALHAWKVSFNNPDSGKNVTVEAPLDEDFKNLLDRYFTNWRKRLYG